MYNLPIRDQAISQQQPADRPILPLWHSLARSGATLIGRCIGSMRGVCLLSEIHPAGLAHFNPLDQAHHWFGLFTPEDLLQISSHPLPYFECIQLIQKRAAAKDRKLVIRSWEHLDYYGLPFVDIPPMRPANLDQLGQHFSLRRATTVRHPIDQWMSLSLLPKMQGQLNLGLYLFGYRRFVETCLTDCVIRYEDFTMDPDNELRRLCAALELEFDASYKDKWPHYATISGDIYTSRGLGQSKISPMNRRELPRGLLAQFSSSADYQLILEALGYHHPG